MISQRPKLFMFYPSRPSNAAAHLLHTVVIKPSCGRYLYRWRCCCGASPDVAWQTAREAELAYTGHSGVRLHAWPPMDVATEVSPTPRNTNPRKKARHG